MSAVGKHRLGLPLEVLLAGAFMLQREVPLQQLLLEV